MPQPTVTVSRAVTYVACATAATAASVSPVEAALGDVDDATARPRARAGERGRAGVGPGDR